MIFTRQFGGFTEMKMVDGWLAALLLRPLAFCFDNFGEKGRFENWRQNNIETSGEEVTWEAHTNGTFQIKNTDFIFNCMIMILVSV